MSARDRAEFEYRRRNEIEAADVEPDSPSDEHGSGRTAEQQVLWVDQQIRAAMERGEFDDLPGAGKPIEGIDRPHDPDWWVKRLIERENISGVLPPALGLRGEDADLDATLDGLARESDVRDELESFNRRVIEARRQLQGGPPVVTAVRDVDAEIAAWRHRRARRAEASASDPEPRTRRRWWRSRRRAD